MRHSKYGAKPQIVDNVRFASQKEARRYSELKLLQAAGEIRELELQPAFPIYAANRFSQQPLELICTYKADFRYRSGPRGLLVIEDVKGMKTPVYRLKKKFVEAQYGIQITEV